MAEFRVEASGDEAAGLRTHRKGRAKLNARQRVQEVPDDGNRYADPVAKRRGVDSSLALAVLEEVSRIVASVDRSLYESHEKLASESSVGTQTTGRSSRSR